MNKLELIYSYPPWFVILCILVGLLYALVLYSKKKLWSKTLNILLASIRTIVVSTICFLLLAPIFKTTKNTLEKPTIVFAVDNSSSIRMAHDSAYTNSLIANINSLRDDLRKKGIKTDIVTLDKSNANIKFDHTSTDLSALLDKVSSTYENRNIDKTILFSDGLINRGVSPIFKKYNFKIHTLGLGDTTQQKDIKINVLFANKVAYLGNQFPIIAQLQNQGYPKQNLSISLYKGGTLIQTQKVNVANDDISEVEFTVKATQKGMQRYAVSVQKLSDEVTHTNNTRDAFVEVIDGREKILMLGYSPHPDFKALKSVIEQNENFSFEPLIIGMGKPKHSKYDLVIAHQIPEKDQLSNAMMAKFKKQGTPIWYILGAQTNITNFNNENKVLTFQGSTQRTDQVSATPNNSFDKLGFDLDKLAKLQTLPPLTVPFGNYTLKPNAEIILYQQLGNITTNKPLLAISKGKNKEAVLIGEGIWQWKLDEYAQTNANEMVDNLVLKVVQYLSTKDDKRKLRVQTTSNEYFDYQKITFQMEAYNDLYERLNDIKVNLSIVGEGKPYNYTFKIGQGNSKYDIRSLPKGVYRYKASAVILGKNHQVTGEFQVKKLQLEALNTQADHDFLKKLSEQNEGKFFSTDQFPLLTKDLIDNPKPDKIHTSEALIEIINFKWLLFVIIALATIEWVFRKYLGSY